MSQLKQITRRATSNQPEEMPLATPRIRIVAGALLVAGLIFLIYWPAIHGGFVMDDDLLLTDNPLIKAPDGLSRIWLSRESVDYWPVANSSLWLQWRLWGMKPTGYHVANLLLHIANCLLIWLLLYRLSIPGAFFAAVLFAVHPVNVESVAWISQHKNLLSLLFFLLSILLFLKSEGLLNRWYALSLIAFTLAMLSKGSVAILPLALLLILWWQNKRITIQNIYQTAPFFAVAIFFTLINIWFQTHGSETAIRTVTFAQRLAGAGAVPWFYLFKALIPVNLVFVYPQWNIQASSLLWWLPLIALIAVSTLLVRLSGFPKTSWVRNLLFAWAFFCIALLPILGFVDVGYMKYSLVADHYQYIALIGIVALVAAAAICWRRKLVTPAKQIFTTCAVLALAFLTLLAWQQSHLYADSIELYETTLKQNPTSWLLHTNLSVDLAMVDRTQEALDHAQEALRLKSDYSLAHSALAVALAKQGKTDEAIDEYRTALKLNPNFAEAACNLGAALGGKGEMSQAVEYLQRAVQLKPYFFEAHRNLARALAALGRLPEARTQLQAAMQLNPDDVDAVINLGGIEHALGRNEEALSYYQQAVRMKPNLPEGYIRLALIYSEMNRLADAIAEAERGLQLAQSSCQTELAGQFESLLLSYRQQQANHSVQDH